MKFGPASHRLHTVGTAWVSDGLASSDPANGYYRFYQMDRADHIRAHCLLRCEHDAAAVAEAGRLLRDYPSVEVWSGARMVGRVSQPADPAFAQ